MLERMDTEVGTVVRLQDVWLLGVSLRFGGSTPATQVVRSSCLYCKESMGGEHDGQLVALRLPVRTDIYMNGERRPDTGETFHSQIDSFEEKYIETNLHISGFRT